MRAIEISELDDADVLELGTRPAPRPEMNEIIIKTIAAPHQQLRTVLGAAREVISRQLQEFQRRGWIEQSRCTVNLKTGKR